ncbi:hypothetical protein DICPUDRAFT_81018 [Dictyostelium purpureum]|uniref:GrpB family protein n=1 Tax=Dictyostelium purpureum TaxID=5786 RepID=F0ZS88_DICPU|nr:uncharacterized protein DICPUDRAFT_81018 [Dictyostelium purpureum]EGC33204.1 hypothetical protein DICPUDRAFT_81018 [Dictyostelium purpureum]|eukprot:XP_003290286.1 hypothetical protein DICPUDRAFT_81018 [Dictyostelium purpureum]
MEGEIEPHNINWKNEFLKFDKEIKQVLNGNDETILINLFHIGSTSIGNGLKSKPIIDMLLVVSDINKLDDQKVKESFGKIGFECMGEFGIINRRYLRKSNDRGIRICQIHSFQFDISLYDIERHLAFRDYLISNPSLCKEYSELKENLIQSSKDNIDDYCNGKDYWIKKIEKESLIWFLKNKK